MTAASPLDLDRYLQRIDYRGAQVGARRVDDPAALAALLVDDIGLPAADVAQLLDTLAARGAA